VIAVSDLAWSPDNMHFVSCATDSSICIWNVNEYCKYASVIDMKRADKVT